MTIRYNLIFTRECKKRAILTKEAMFIECAVCIKIDEPLRKIYTVVYFNKFPGMRTPCN